MRLLDGLGFEIVHVTPASARRVARAHEMWGKDVHPAALCRPGFRTDGCRERALTAGLEEVDPRVVLGCRFTPSQFEIPASGQTHVVLSVEGGAS